MTIVLRSSSVIHWFSRQNSAFLKQSRNPGPPTVSAAEGGFRGMDTWRLFSNQKGEGPWHSCAMLERFQSVTSMESVAIVFYSS